MLELFQYLGIAILLTVVIYKLVRETPNWHSSSDLFKGD